MPWYGFVADVIGSIKADNEADAQKYIRKILGRYGSVDIVELYDEEDDETTARTVNCCLIKGKE